MPAHEKPVLASAVVLAGGESRRMGRDKAWIEVAGKPLLNTAVETVRALGIREVFVSGRPGEDYSSVNCPVLFDVEPGFGPMGGIERALHECNSALLLVLAVDLFRMHTAFLRKMLDRCDRLTGVVPRLKGEFEPLAAVYPKRCHAIAVNAILNSRHAVRDFVNACLTEQAVRTMAVAAADAVCFTNANSPADLQERELCNPTQCVAPAGGSGKPAEQARKRMRGAK